MSSANQQDSNTITLDLSGAYDTAAQDTFTFSDDDTITLSNIAYPYIGGTGLSYDGNAQIWSSSNDWGTGSGQIHLDGENADIKVNGKSLMESIEKIEERLNILTPNANLEHEWAELKALGDKYRELEKHILAKQATWDKLKAMPPPEID